MLPLNLKFIYDSVYMSWILVICMYLIGVTEQSDTIDYKNQDEFLRLLGSYEITIPSRVTREGHHVTYKLHPRHQVRKRSVDSDESFHEEFLHYKVRVEDKDLVLKIKPNHNLVSPGLVIERRKSRFNNVSDSSFRGLNDVHKNCHYHGEILNDTDSRVALGVCNGLTGFIHTSDVEYFIEPVKGDNPDRVTHHRHVVYRRSALPGDKVPQPRRDHGDECGVKDDDSAIRNRERWELYHRRKRASKEDPKAQGNRRRKRSVSTERYVEALVVVDPKMVEYHESEHLETYILTIMNMVAAMFHDATVGNSMNIVLVRILLMEEHEEELVITHHADKTLKSFCKFQNKINFKDDDHPNHHDVAILLTRQNICSRLNEPCSTLGLAQVSGMCQPHRSCNINEDTGLALAFTVTHELGHNFGMHHDGKKNGCKDPPGKQLYIMSPNLVADSLTKRWSTCSKAAITSFIDRDWGYCLDDEPAEHDYKFPVRPPGTMYDADHQCRLQYGTADTSVCTSNLQDICANLWCRVDNRCSTHLEAAAEGTICGPNKWCYQGDCVKIGDRPEAINGEWGQWSGWTPCTRTCGAGVSHSQRHCDNPQPSHGGKYCLGERKRYRLCNTENCPDDGKSFQTVQCEEFNYVPYKNGLYEWKHVPMTDSPCQLHCRPKNQFFSVLLKDIVTDGTPCTPGTKNMCISGRCRHVGCDYVIDSKAVEDRCGICHGDGSSCTTIKSQYNETQGLGYVEAAVIPMSARNIRVEEVAAANNFLALQNDEGEYYLNGHWFIQWSGDYDIAGTVVQYKRIGNKESFHAPGPLKEPLHIMLLLQSENPGLVFEYTIPKENISDLRVPEFHWEYQTWTHCTASCGGGTQRSEIVCVEIEAGVVEDKYCDVSTKPDDKQKVCNEHLCPARWWNGPWQHCSVTCGDQGTHQRTVICVRSLGPDEQIALEDEECVGLEKPREVEPCHRKDMCPGTSPWVVGDWSSCNGSPCGLKYRTVSCEDMTVGCYENPVPASEGKCSNVSCGHWVTEEWQECTRSCEGGVQVRKVTCEGGEHCDPLKEPDSGRDCNTEPCPSTTTQVSSTSTELLPTGTTPTSSISADTETVAVSSEKPNTETTTRDTIDQNTESTSDTEKETVETDEASANIEIDRTFENESVLTASENVNLTLKQDDLQISSDSDEPTDTEYVEENVFSKTSDTEQTVDSQEPDSQELKTETWSESPRTTGAKDNSDVLIKTTTVKSSLPTEEDKENLEPEVGKADPLTEVPVPSDGLMTEADLGDVKTTTVKATTDTPTTMKQSDLHHGNHHHDNNKHQEEHRHRHHHGDLPKVTEGTEGSEERQPLGELTGEEVTGGSLSVKHADVAHSTVASTEGTSQQVDTTTVSRKDTTTASPAVKTSTAGRADPAPEEANTDQSVSAPVREGLPALPENLPPLPSNGDLPSLESLSLPPLPDKKDLPPLAKDLPPLPKDLPPLPEDMSASPDLPPLPKELPPLPEDLSSLPIDLPSLPENMSAVPDVPPLPKELPPLPEDLSSVPKDSLPAPEDMSAVPDLPPLPKELPPISEDLSSLPKDLPPLPEDMSALPDLPPLPKELPSIPEDLSPLPQKSFIPALQNREQPSSFNEDVPPLPKSSEDMPKLPPMPGMIPENMPELPKSHLKDSMESLSSAPGRYLWQHSDWTQCSRHCGGGVRTRSVWCIDTETQEEVVKTQCDITSRPTAIDQECNMSPCLAWEMTKWTPCSATCGWSVQKRRVYCPVEMSCDPDKKPIETKTCDMPKCVAWVSGQWSRCDKTCGGGHQFRLVQCVNLTSQQSTSGCRQADKPTDAQECNKDACPDNKSAALRINCVHNEMSSVVCRALRKMNQCHRRYVRLKCCRTCEMHHKNLYRPKTHALR